MTSSEALPTSALRALVVDDDLTINRLLQLRLEGRGFRVQTVYSGEAALAQVSAQRPDVIFLDVSLPGISGLEVLEQVRAKTQDMAVIMTTAFGSEQVATDALRHGADDYLRKPFEPAEFETVLDRTVSRLQLSRQNTALRQALDEKRRQLEMELARAGKVQTDLLPHSYPSLPRFQLAARCLPAREVGGDFYDWQQVAPGVLSLTMGDVMGKGMPAALLMATVRAALRTVAGRNSPALTLEMARRALTDDLDRSGSFVTIFHAQLEAAGGHLAYVDAGHGYVFIRRANGTVKELPLRGLPLGIPSPEPYQEGVHTFCPGDALVLYSDGLIEAQPTLGASNMQVARALAGATSAEAMVERLIAQANPDGPPPDDLTVVILLCTR